jgi:V-type H+-transporting ATPase subunit a
MELIQMIVQNDAAHVIIEALGALGICEFRDLNAGTSLYKRSFVDEVRKCEELARILRMIQEELQENSVPLGLLDTATAPLLAALEPKIVQTAEEIKGLKDSQDMLKKNHNSLLEQRTVLDLGKGIYQTHAPLAAAAATTPDRMASVELMSLSEFGAGTSSMLGQVAGMINREHTASLERVVFRATRGNAVFKSMPAPVPLLDTNAKGGAELVDKDFFMVFFAGEVLKDKVSKIASYFGAALYKFPEVTADHMQMTKEVARRIIESQDVMERGTAVMRELLVSVGVSYPTWSYVCAKEKMSYDALNMCEFDIKRHVFVAQMWVPKVRYGDVEAALLAAALQNGLDTRPIMNKLTTKLTPPTHIPVTSFSFGFQALVNTYGTPRYRECNPGAFCCIMFPFLFGIMFGDFGHGFLLACFGFWLRSKEKEWEGKSLNDMVQMCYGGRYVIMLNGLFGMYVGLCYNEAFAFPMNFFGGTRWMANNAPDEFCSPEWSENGGCIMEEMYPMGIDPIWHRTTNKITFFNSYKMKISIVVGVLQMSVGIVLSLLNHLEYRDWKKVFFQFVPEFVFFQGIFGYLVFTIIYKWSVDWNGQDGVPHVVGPPGPEPAPSLLTLLINMFMSPTSDIVVPLYGHVCFTDCAAASGRTSGIANYCSVASVAEACPTSCATSLGLEDTLATAASGMETKLCVSPTQSSIQFSLLIAAFVAVPFLLFPIPFIELYQYKRSAKYKELQDENSGGGGHGDEDSGFSFGDAFIHQAIHTIEFVLGSISNTASYLRLWALSLAHSQLAELFKDMILVGAGLNLGLGPTAQWIMTFVCFGAWAIISFVVLMVMENLSSFLHALRLQWVEFQNKFFYGDGQKYAPFDFEKLKKTADDE